jgi:SLA1 homology domain 1, SHD1
MHGSSKFPVILRLAAVALAMQPLNPIRCRAAEAAWPERFQYRMVLLHNTSLSSDAELETAKQQLRQAAITGYNCAVLATSGNLIQPQIAGDDYLARLRLLREEADYLGIGLVPSVMPFDSDALTKQFDPHLAEGLPARNLLYIVTGDKAHLRADPPIALTNSEFENAGQDGIPGWLVTGDLPGRTIEIDSSQALYGNSSLRFRNADERTGVVSYAATQKVWLPPFRLFRVSIWIRSDDPGQARCARLVARIGGRYLGKRNHDPTEACEWDRLGLLFNSLSGGETDLSVSVRASESRAHTIWFDSLEIEHVGFANLSRRPDCPVVVRNERGRAYEEGRDFELVDGQSLASTAESSFDDDDTPQLTLARSTRIRDGERLRVSFHSSTCCCQISLCTSSRRVYDFFADGINPLREGLAPFGYHLATKYITTANWDNACLRTKKTPGAQWGDSLLRQIKILSGSGSRPVCFVWSDMYEPWTDPHRKYWVRNGTFEDAWQYLPKDFVVLNANYTAEKSKSPRFFAANGYSQVIAGDAKVGEWMQANAGIPGIVGVMNVDAPLDEFAAKAWGWLPKEVRDKLPPTPKPEGDRRKVANESPARENKPPSASASEIRTWTDTSGKYTVEAAFIKVKASVVTLRKRDGSEITIPFNTLSSKDRRWLIREVKSNRSE